MVYLDFAKAFDMVSHKRPFKKLESYGVIGRLLDWTGEFMEGRRLRVLADEMFSGWTRVLSYVPQESVLGQFLFL